MKEKLSNCMRILGIDPGYGIIGFGVIDSHSRSDLEYVDSGAITTDKKAEFSARLNELYEDMVQVLDKYKPEIVVVERLFFAQNVTTAMMVAEARGVILLAAERFGAEIHEYTPLQIKMALTGDGKAKKSQVKDMVLKFLKVDKIPGPDDVLDALAVAITCV
jgi:crossover junction endodeoxyribonuclease RuvC